MNRVISKDRRAIYSRRIKSFWAEFSHNRIGFVGLLLLSVYIVMAVFAPWLTPYDPLSSTRVAEGFAMPSWMKVFPQYSDYPYTMHISPIWDVQSGSEFVVGAGREAQALIDISRNPQPINITLTASFNYPYSVSPSRYISQFGFEATGLENAFWGAELSIINANGNRTRIWYETYTKQEVKLGVDQDSYNYYLLQKEMGDPKATNLAEMIFAAPTKGEYKLIFHVSLLPDPPEAITMKANIVFRQFQFFIPGLVHGVLGTDFLGTDVLSQVIYGSRISLVIGLMAAAISTSVGVLVGIVSGYLGGATDEVTMRIVDILLCLPTLPLLLTLVKLFGKNIFYIVLFIAIFGWLGLSRVIRSQILYLRETTFVECAVASGASKQYVMLKHLLPNIVPVALASLVLEVPGAVLSEAGLSFLGFGDPRVPTWGKMLNYAFGHGAFENFAWWWAIPPGLAITFLSLTFVFMGFAIDEIVNPRLRRRR
jgi:peptide/nickel transport system permease protein